MKAKSDFMERVVVQLTSSTFYGGPERQMLGLAHALGGEVHTVFFSFGEGGRCRAFLDEALRQGFEAHALEHDTPHFGAAVRELAGRLRRAATDILLCHGYKAGLLGRLAARWVGIPIVAVSRGWTYESPKIRLYELIDRINLRWMDRIVCVSQGQAAKVRRAGVPARKIVVIPNAIQAERFDHPDPIARTELERLFPHPVRRIVGAAGRLSPEKGFADLVEAATLVAQADSHVGFVLFGDGFLRAYLSEQIAALGLTDQFVLAGFRTDLDRLIPHLDLMVQSSYTEGLPNVILEACAAGVAVVATAVGGTPEVVEAGRNGWLVPPGNPQALSRAMLDALSNATRRQDMGAAGREQVRSRFTFVAQAAAYRRLVDELTSGREHRATSSQSALEGTRPLADSRR